MLLLNGSTNADVTAWEQTISVVPGRAYVFAGYLAAWGDAGGNTDPSPATLRVTINGQPLTPDLALSPLAGRWSAFADLWTAGPSTMSAVLRITDTNTQLSGNDFAIDDLTFVAVPEPAGIALTAFGSFCLVTRRARRQNH